MVEEMFAKAFGRDLPISTKSTIMVCAFLRGRKLSVAKNVLHDVINKRVAVPFTRFNDGVGHRKTTKTAGRYPLKASEAVLRLLESAEANALDHGMTGDLIIVDIRANKGSSTSRYGRHSRRSAKRTHVYVTLKELPGTRKVVKKKSLADKIASSSESSSSEPSKSNVLGSEASGGESGGSPVVATPVSEPDATSSSGVVAEDVKKKIVRKGPKNASSKDKSKDHSSESGDKSVAEKGAKTSMKSKTKPVKKSKPKSKE